MENLRRIIIPWTDNGYNFNFNASDTIHSCVALITTVVKNSPAEAAGLRVGDGIVSINGNLLRGLAKSEIYSLIKNFRNATLILTVLQNYDHIDDKKVDGLTFPNEKSSQNHRYHHYIPPMNTKMLSLKYTGLLAEDSGRKDSGTHKKARKFSKYTRNMSDVTQQTSRFYYNPGSMADSCCHRPTNCFGLSPPQRTGLINFDMVPSCVTHQLELNRVGGILRKPVSSTDRFRNNLIVIKPQQHEMERKAKFTYLTCSPIPYRSGRVLDVSEIQERRSLPEQSVRDSLLERMSSYASETKEDQSLCSPESPIATQDGLASVTSDTDLKLTIDPVPVKILWRFVDNSEVCNPTWQDCTISVETGMFRVQEVEATDKELVIGRESRLGVVSGLNLSNWTDQETGLDNDCSLSTYNFRYRDSGDRRWEFLVQFPDRNSSAKWMHFFDESALHKPKREEQDQDLETACTTENIEHGGTQNLSVETLGPAIEVLQATSAKTESASGKGKLHHALTRVRNFTQRRLNSTDSQSDFKRQQEEWLQKTEPYFIMVSEKEESKEMTVNICTDHLGYLGDRVQIPHLATLPLDKWQRSVVSPLIPLVVEICVKVIEKFGIHHVGIYRVSGNKLSLDSINNELRRPLSDIDLNSDMWNDIYAISGVLKSFLRNLPEGVFPKDFYSEIIGAWKLYERDREKRLLSVQRQLSILDSVPAHLEYRYHRETLRYLASHLFVVASKHAINKMTAKNLAVVFAPTLLRPPVETNEILMSDYRFRIELVESIINHHEWMFSPSFESACSIPEEVDQENTLLSEMQFESFSEDQLVADSTSENQGDARVLIREIIDQVREMSPNLAHSDADSNQYTLIELNTIKERNAENTAARQADSTRYSEQVSLDLSPETSETLSIKEKKASKRLSFKLSKSKHVKSNLPREQLLLTNKKLCALSVALISSNRHPLNSALISENESPKIAVE